MQFKQEPLSKHSSLRIGNVNNIFIPNNIAELTSFLKSYKHAVCFIGLGSNVLFTKNFNNIVIKTYKLNTITINKNIIKAYSGVTLKKLTDFAKLHNITGANWLATIPGTVGGALKMNAGCFGYDFWHSVINVEIIKADGKIVKKSKKEFKPLYRGIKGLKNNEHFISCELIFNNNDIADDIINSRYQKQPIGTANCGSVFKNPPKLYAAKLIEKTNLKGVCVGGACISDKHANFIINKGNATSDDVIRLINYVKKQVMKKFNIKLETELVIL